MAKKTTTSKPAKPGKSAVPGTYKAFVGKYPALGRAHESVAKAVDEAGPLDAKTLALVKIGICIGAGLESALRSHVRRAMQHGASGWIRLARRDCVTLRCSKNHPGRSMCAETPTGAPVRTFGMWRELACSATVAGRGCLR